ncbi:MAG: amidohydrolase, partial [Gammaproteobacteria bacterium]|nr:amidohydrolase [Gemmatimonadota bacterium]NIU78572.1 amidohydrolase [Gammaproteobacteria bacterium]NIX20556.1 amidohydrolase [Actinomycetota bacterium]
MEKRLVSNERAEEIVPSADGRWVAFKELHDIYVAPLPRAGGQPVAIGKSGSGVPVETLTRYGGNWIDWSADGRSVSYVLGPTVYRHTLEGIFADGEAETDAAAGAEGEDGAGAAAEQDAEQPNNIPAGDAWEIRLRVPKARPAGTVALTGARIVTMRGDEVIEDGTIVVEGPRIRAVGPTGGVDVPTGARTVDVSGKTIIPGLIDVH